MSELQHIKQEVHRMVDEASSEELITSIYNQLQSSQGPFTPMSAIEEERLREAWEDVKAGRVYPAEEVYSRIREKFGYKPRSQNGA